MRNYPGFHQCRNLRQCDDRVIRLHLVMFLRSRDFDPDAPDTGIACSGDVALQAVADHHSVLRTRIEFRQQTMKDLGLGLANVMLAGDRNGCKERLESGRPQLLALQVRRAIRQQSEFVRLREADEDLSGIRHETGQLSPLLRKNGGKVRGRLAAVQLLLAQRGIEHPHTVIHRPISQGGQIGRIPFEAAPETFEGADSDPPAIGVDGSRLVQLTGNLAGVALERFEIRTHGLKCLLCGAGEGFRGNRLVHDEGVVEIE